MVDVDRAIIARLKKGSDTFEILVDCDKALALQGGSSVSLGDVVATNDIFKDVRKGDKAPESLLVKLFGTSDVDTISLKIIKEGEIQLTAKHKEQLREQKKRRIIEIIHRNAIDSQTKLPHPPQRIERAMEEAKVKIDENKTAEGQIEDVLKKIRAIIPIKFETLQLAVRTPPQYAGQVIPLLKRYTLLKEEWTNDGSLAAIVEIPAGIQDEFFSQLNKATRGEVETKLLNSR